uniref:E3 ubiquitin-protein ligase rnf152-B-like n=1 Tax=Oncorhynchus gorbuscha TaxID=8017 RepID=UPI001EAECA66|nr:E3 ubiquitin-protein ligase rnf152-B-like [Oncorhynchus gorbuscha]
MESLSQQESILDCQISQQDSMLECQICFNYYSLWRRPKLLDCQHTCCSVCLTQMRMSQSELRCPWCRCVTTLPPGVSVSQLLDDPDTMAIISVPYTPVFMRLPCNTYLPVEHHERATGMEEEHGMREGEEGFPADLYQDTHVNWIPTVKRSNISFSFILIMFQI